MGRRKKTGLYQFISSINWRIDRQEVVNFLRDEKTKITLGLTFLFFAAFMFLSFTSFLFTWEQDQSTFDLTWWQIITNKDVRVENWAGKIGAGMANLFIYKFLGIASFGFVYLFTVIGFRLLKYRIMPLRQSIKYSFIIMIWVSIATGYFFSNKYFTVGGSHGYFISETLNDIIGKFGTFFVVMISLFGIIIYTFNDALPWLKLYVPWAYQYVKAKIKKQPTPQMPKYLRTEPEVEDEIEVPKKSKFRQKPEVFLGTNDEGFDLVNSDVYKEEELDEDEYEDDIAIEEGELVEKKEYILNDDGTTSDIGFEVNNPTKDNEVILENDNQTVLPFDQNNGDEKISLSVETHADKMVSEINNLTKDYDPTLDLSRYRAPSLDLLEDHKAVNSEVTKEELISNKNTIVETLRNYKIEIKQIKATIGPTVTLYEIIPAPGVRISKIKNLEDDIAFSPTDLP